MSKFECGHVKYCANCDVYYCTTCDCSCDEKRLIADQDKKREDEGTKVHFAWLGQLVAECSREDTESVSVLSSDVTCKQSIGVMVKHYRKLLYGWINRRDEVNEVQDDL